MNITATTISLTVDDPAAPRPEHAGLYAVSGISTMDDIKPGVEPGVFNMTFARNGAKKAGPVKRRLQALLMRVFVPLLYEKATAWLYSHEPTHPLPDHTTARLREQAEGGAK